MTADANVITGSMGAEPPNGHPAAPEPSADTAASPVPPPARAWSMPKSPVSRKHVDDAGRVAAKVLTGFVHGVAGLARFGARILTQAWRAIDEVPPALQLLFCFGLFALLGVVGSIALSGTLGLLCAIVVVPVCSIVVGALGHRWYTRHDEERTDVRASAAGESELQRSVLYVDKKLTLALNSFGSERHQQAVIALFQAKTAVELALGTEQETVTHIDEPVAVEDYGLRPRIQPGSGSSSALPESNSLAAS